MFWMKTAKSFIVLDEDGEFVLDGENGKRYPLLITPRGAQYVCGD